MKKILLGQTDISISKMGLGCMGMSEFYGPTNDQTSLSALQRAYDLGVNFYDTADMYGRGHNEQLLGAFRKQRPDIVIATKFGIVREQLGHDRRIDNSPNYIQSAMDASLKRLRVDHIDLYYAHRVDPQRPIEETVEAMAKLVKAGKTRAIGLCEISAQTLRRAQKIHPIIAVQSEYSLWSREVEEDVLPACREAGAIFIAYSPLGRGLLTGAVDMKTTFAADDFRNISPRFQGDNLVANLALIEVVRTVAARHGVSVAQVALAWTMAREDRIVPIPGSKRIPYIEENFKAVDLQLTKEDLALLDEAFAPQKIAGDRYPQAGMANLNVDTLEG